MLYNCRLSLIHAVKLIALMVNERFRGVYIFGKVFFQCPASESYHFAGYREYRKYDSAFKAVIYATLVSADTQTRIDKIFYIIAFSGGGT